MLDKKSPRKMLQVVCDSPGWAIAVFVGAAFACSHVSAQSATPDGFAPLVTANEFGSLELTGDEPVVTWVGCPDCGAIDGCLCGIETAPAPSHTSSDFPTVALTGFFQVDATWLDVDREDLTGNDIARFSFNGDRRGFRRARLAAKGKTAENVDYLIEFDFAFPGRPTFMDLYFDVHDLPFGSLRVGQWRQPFGLGELTSVRSLTFHERASMFFLGPFRKTGVGIHHSNQRSTYALSLFGGTRGNVPDQFGTSFGDSTYGVAGRLTTLLLNQQSQLLHIGAGYSHLQLSPDFGTPFFSINVPPEIVGAPIENTGLPGTLRGFVQSSDTNLFNSEIAFVSGPLHVESELRFAHFERIGEDAIAPSFYAQTGYFLTGESQPYDRETGVLAGVTPNNPFGRGGCGAWELAARYSHLDLQGDLLNAGRTNNFLVGLNWYLNANTKFQFNYLQTLIESNQGEETLSAYSLRGQVAF